MTGLRCRWARKERPEIRGQKPGKWASLAAPLHGGARAKIRRRRSRRLVYGVKLAENVWEYLLGFDKRPRWIGSQGGASAAGIVEWWRERWVRKRIERAEVLERIERETLVRPVRHGARVVLPRDASQGVLFE